MSFYYFEKVATAKDLVKILRGLSTTFGVAENLTSDDGPQFRAHEFLARLGIEHRVIAAYNPHSNLRAESAMKTAKRMLMSSTRSDGFLNWDHVA